MNVANLSRGQMIAGAGGLLLVIALFLHWAGGTSAWDGFSSVHILMLLIGIAAVAWAALPAVGSTVVLPPASPLILAALGVAVFGWAFGFELEVGGGIGVWLAILASLGIAYGAYESTLAPTVPARRTSAATGPPPPPTAPAV